MKPLFPSTDQGQSLNSLTLLEAKVILKLSHLLNGCFKTTVLLLLTQGCWKAWLEKWQLLLLAVITRRLSKALLALAAPGAVFKALVVSRIISTNITRSATNIVALAQSKSSAYYLHDSDMIKGQQEGTYLQRSAKLLREQVVPPLPHSINCIDKKIRLLLDAQGMAVEKLARALNA